MEFKQQVEELIKQMQGTMQQVGGLTSAMMQVQSEILTLNQEIVLQIIAKLSESLIHKSLIARSRIPQRRFFSGDIVSLTQSKSGSAVRTFFKRVPSSGISNQLLHPCATLNAPIPAAPKRAAISCNI